jgi:hypothetical protein
MEVAKKGRDGGREEGGLSEVVDVAVPSDGLELMEGGEARQRGSRAKEWKSWRRRGRAECYER